MRTDTDANTSSGSYEPELFYLGHLENRCSAGSYTRKGILVRGYEKNVLITGRKTLFRVLQFVLRRRGDGDFARDRRAAALFEDHIDDPQ